MTTKPKGLDRKEILKEVTSKIKESPNGEREIPSSEIGDIFGVKGGTIDYHLRMLVEQGDLILLEKRGRFNRKVYRLPNADEQKVLNEKYKEKSSKNGDIELVYNDSQLEEFKKLIKLKMQDNIIPVENSILEDKEKSVEEDYVETNSLEDLIKDEAKEEFIEEPTIEEPKELFEEDIEPEREIPVMEKSIPVQAKEEEPMKELSLDQNIELFLKNSKSVPTAEQLLSHQDKEILSVMNESIHQNIVYLKDLSQQLSTVENKQLIQSLIDERNLYLEEKKRIQEENDMLRREVQDKTGKFDLDPMRIRHIQQNMVNVLDTFLDQPNHALALSRHEFRKQMTDQIKDAFTYILNLER